MAAISAWAASARLAVPHGGRREAERDQRRLEVGRHAVAGVEVEGEEAQAALGDHRRVLGAQRAGGGAARVDQRLVGMGGVVGGEGGAQHHELPPHLDAVGRAMAGGTPSASARTSTVTSSPVVPSPRVTARARRPPS